MEHKRKVTSMTNIVHTIRELDNRLAKSENEVKKMKFERESLIGSVPIEQVENIVRRFHPKCDWFSIHEVACVKSKKPFSKIVCIGTDFKIGFLIDGDAKKDGFDSRHHHYSIAFDFRTFKTGVYPIKSQPGWQGHEAADGAEGIAIACKKHGVKVLVAHDKNFNWCGSWISQNIKPAKLVNPYDFLSLAQFRSEVYKLIPRNFSERAAQKCFLGLELVRLVTTDEDYEADIETFERMSLLSGKCSKWTLKVPEHPVPPPTSNHNFDMDCHPDHIQSVIDRVEDYEYRESMRGENLDC